MTQKKHLALVLLLPALLFAGCISRNAPEVAYYSLQSIEQLGPDRAGQPGQNIVLGIGPVTLPASLKRSQIVTREADNRYQFSDLHRWAGLLEEDLARTIGENLAFLLDLETVVYHPWGRVHRPDRRLLVEVLRFDGSRQGEAVLSVRWTLTGGEGTQPLAGGKSVYRQPVAGGGYAGLVRTESLLLAALSREIAEAIRQTVE